MSPHMSPVFLQTLVLCGFPARGQNFTDALILSPFVPFSCLFRTGFRFSNHLFDFNAPQPMPSPIFCFPAAGIYRFPTYHLDSVRLGVLYWQRMKEMPLLVFLPNVVGRMFPIRPFPCRCFPWPAPSCGGRGYVLQWGKLKAEGEEANAADR